MRSRAPLTEDAVMAHADPPHGGTDLSVARPPEELTAESAVRFAGSLQAMRQMAPQGVTVDLSQVTHCSLPGLAALVDAVNEMRSEGYVVTITGATDRVTQLATVLRRELLLPPL